LFKRISQIWRHLENRANFREEGGKTGVNGRSIGRNACFWGEKKREIEYSISIKSILNNVLDPDSSGNISALTNENPIKP